VGDLCGKLGPLAKSTPARHHFTTQTMMSTVNNSSSRDRRLNTLLLVLAGFFVGNALLAELIGGKLFQVPTPWHTFTLSCGVILWPVVFIMTDIINEYFGRRGVRKLSILTAVIIAYAFVALWMTGYVKAVGFSPVDDKSFGVVFFQSQWIIVGSIAAFLLAQLIDVTVFWIIRRHTGKRFLWLRATGSTLVSQLIDTFVVGFIGLYLPWRLGYSKAAEPFTFDHYLNTSTSGYIFKVAVAIGVTPALYIIHAIIDGYLGAEQAEMLIETTAEREDAGDIA
jgi:queuosine precursor transporter